MSITRIFQEATLQGLGGVLIGGFLDNYFGQSEQVNEHNFLKITGEVIGQLAVVTLVSTAYFDFLIRKGMRGDDPTKGVPFILALISSQPKLNLKLGQLSHYAGSFTSNFTGILATVESDAAATFKSIRTDEASADVPAGKED